MEATVLNGSCLCGRVTYKSTSLPTGFSYCYCRACRRHTGSAFGAWMDVPHLSLEIEEAGFMLQQKSDLAIRSSCKDCGSPMFMTYYAQPDTIAVAAGTIDEESVKGELAKLDSHIFVSEKSGWFRLPDDGVKRYEKFPPGYEDALETWKRKIRKT